MYIVTASKPKPEPDFEIKVGHGGGNSKVGIIQGVEGKGDQ
jgi:hypothetical protein